MTCSADVPDGVVDVAAKRVAALIAIEERQEHLERKRGRREERIRFERAQDEVAELARNRMLFRQLQVLLHASRLVAGRHPSVYPGGLIEFLSRLCRLFERQNGG